MRKAHPAKFVQSNFPQILGHPEFCASLVEQLFTNQPKDLESAFEFVQEKIKRHPEFFKPYVAGEDVNFSKQARKRNKKSFAYTIIYKDGPYFGQVRQELKLKGHDVDIGGLIDMQNRYEVTNTNPGIDPIIIPLTRISNCRNPYTAEKYPNFRLGELAFLHPVKDEGLEEEIYFSEMIWAESSRFFSNATNEKLPPASRKRSSYIFYGLTSHNMPVESTTNSIVRILLEYLALCTGFNNELLPTKEPHSLNIAALVNAPEEFAAVMMDPETRAKYFIDDASFIQTKRPKILIREGNNLDIDTQKRKSDIVSQIIQEFAGKMPILLEDVISNLHMGLERGSTEAAGVGAELIDDIKRLEIVKSAIPGLQEKDHVHALYLAALLESGQDPDKTGFVTIKGNGDNFFVRLRAPDVSEIDDIAKIAAEKKVLTEIVLNLLYPEEHELKNLYRQMMLTSEWINVKEIMQELSSRNKREVQ